MKAIIFGAPGSGKGTYASRLQNQFELDVVSTGDIFRRVMKEDTVLGKKVKFFVEGGILVPDDVVIAVLKKRLGELANGRGFILDGYPRTIEQAEALESLTEIDVVLLLLVPEWIIIERLSSRRICKSCGAVYNVRYLKPKVEMVCDKCSGLLYQRPDDTAEVIRRRIKVYQEQTHPIIQHFKDKGVPLVVSKCEAVDTPPKKVVKSIVEELKKLELI